MGPQYTEGMGRPREFKRTNFNAGNFSTVPSYKTVPSHNTHSCKCLWPQGWTYPFLHCLLFSYPPVTGRTYCNPSTNTISFFPPCPGTQSRKLSINRRQSCGISVPPPMYCYTRGGNRHKGLRKNWNTRTVFQVYSYVLVQCSLVNLSRASTQVLSLTLHCYYRGWFLLIITFHWLQHTDFLHCWYCCLEMFFQISTQRTDYHPLKDVRTGRDICCSYLDLTKQMTA